MTRSTHRLFGSALGALVLAAGLTACDQSPRNADLTPPPPGPEPANPPAPEPTPSMEVAGSAVAEQTTATTEVAIVSAQDPSQRLGRAMLVQQQEGLVVRFNIAPNDVISEGEHAIHIHQNGSCDPADTNGDGTAEAAGAAGGHFNPANAGHGEDNGPHAGDSEEYNYSFNEDGSFDAEVTFPMATLRGEHSVMREGGTAIVIHEGTDDEETDPSGDAGPRIACGVIMPQEQVANSTTF